MSRTVGDDVFAIDGYGTIHLRLCQDSYQSLGLTGRPSRFGPPRQYFIVEIKMRDHAMRSGKKGYERTRGCLRGFPSSMFGACFGTDFKSLSRRWEVVLSWTSERGEIEPIDLSGFSTAASIKTCLPTLDWREGSIALPPVSKIDLSSLDTLKDIYDEIGQSTMVRSSHMEKAGVPIISIRAIGFYHPSQLTKLVQSAAKDYDLAIVSAHTAPFSPFSFLVNRQKQTPPLSVSNLKIRKKFKKGKSAMRGPERDVQAGPTCWTLIVLPVNDEVLVPVGRRSKLKPNSNDGHKPASGSELNSSNRQKRPGLSCEEACDGDRDSPTRKKLKSDIRLEASGCTCQRRWVMYESVGARDTHC